MPRPNLSLDARRAQEIMADPVFDRAFELVREDLVQELEGKTTAKGPTPEREHEICCELRALVAVRGAFSKITHEKRESQE